MAFNSGFNHFDDEPPEGYDFAVGGKGDPDTDPIKTALFCLKQLTTYEAYTIIPIGENEDDNEDNEDNESKCCEGSDDGTINHTCRSGSKRRRWADAHIEREYFRKEDIIKTILKLNDGRSSIMEKKDKLSPHQRMQVTNILENKITNDIESQVFEWELAQLHQEERKNPKTKTKEITSVTFYLKRSPKPRVNVVRMYREHCRRVQRQDMLSMPVAATSEHDVAPVQDWKRTILPPFAKSSPKMESMAPSMPLKTERSMSPAVDSGENKPIWWEFTGTTNTHNHVSQENTGSVPLASVYNSIRHDQRNEPTSNYWNVREESIFPTLVSYHGTDWHGIAESIGTKTHIMVKDYYRRQVDSGRFDLEKTARLADEKRNQEKSATLLPTQIMYQAQLQPHMPIQHSQQPQQLHQLQGGTHNRALDSRPQLTPEEVVMLMSSESGGKEWENLVFTVAQRCMDAASEEEKNEILTNIMNTIPVNVLDHYQSIGLDFCYSHYYDKAEYDLEQEKLRLLLAKQQLNQSTRPRNPWYTVPPQQQSQSPNVAYTREPQQQMLGIADFGSVGSFDSQHKNMDLDQEMGQNRVPLNTQKIRAWNPFRVMTDVRTQKFGEVGLADETRPEARKNNFQDVYFGDKTSPDREKASYATLRTPMPSDRSFIEDLAQGLEESDLDDYVPDWDPWKTDLEEHFKGSRFPKEQRLGHSLQESKLEKHSKLTKGNISETDEEVTEGSFTDSAYVSMHKTDSSLIYKPRYSISDKPDVAVSNVNAEDGCETVYSAATTIDLPHSQQYIAELCTDIFRKLENYFDSSNWNTLEVALPSLIKAFAVKIGHDSSSQVHQDIMYFIHKQHLNIISHLKVMFCREDDAQPNGRQSVSKGMSLLDKMSMWDSKSGEIDTVTESKEFFKGVGDDDDEITNDVDLSKYYGIILKTPSYEWLLSSLRKERLLKWDLRQPSIMVKSIRQAILDKLPTGTISKRRPLSACELTFNLQWGDSTDKEKGLFARLITLDVLLSELITVTGCREESQALTVEQYLCQTWPVYGLQLLNVLKKAIAYPKRHHSVTLPDNTQLDARIRGSRFIITATGPAHFIAECAEQLAWIQAALISNSRNTVGFCAPSIENYVVKATHSPSKQLKYEGYCGIAINFTLLANPTDDIPQKQSWWQDLVGKPTVIQGFPILRRPEASPGLELSFELLLSSVKTDKAIINDGLILLKGPVSILQLFKHTNDVFLWLPFHPGDGICSCGENHINIRANISCSSFDLRRIKAGRHILGVCRDLLPTMEENSEKTCENVGALEAEYVQHGASRGPPENLRTTAASQIPVHPNFQNDETNPRVSVCSQVDYLNPKKGLPDYTENSEDDMLLNDQTLHAEDSPSDATVQSQKSLDSDLFSISDSSEQFEIPECNAAVNALVDDVVHKLVSGFRSTIQCQVSPDTSGNSGQCTTQETSTEPPTSSNNSGQSQKRRRAIEEEDDDANRDDFPKPPRKRIYHGPDETTSRLFACPYLKLDPVKHANCCTKKLRRIRDVKQHLSRRHTPDRYCQRCLSTNFCDEQTLQGHVDLNTCLRNDPTALEGISNEQQKRLSRKSDSKINEEGQWFVIWEILFIRRARPSSAYMETGLSMELGLFREYCSTHGPSTIEEELLSDPIWAGSETTIEERQVYNQMVLARGLSRLFEEYRRSTSALESQRGRNAPYREHRGNSMQDSQYDPPLSSADSGIAVGSLGSQSSPREMSSRRQIPNQSTFISDNGGQRVQYEAPISSVADNAVAVGSQFSRQHIPSQPTPAFIPDNEGQHAQYETPISSVTGSAVAVGSQFPPLGMSSQRHIPDQPAFLSESGGPSAWAPHDANVQMHPDQPAFISDSGGPSTWMPRDDMTQMAPDLGDDSLNLSKRSLGDEETEHRKTEVELVGNPSPHPRRLAAVTLQSPRPSGRSSSRPSSPYRQIQRGTARCSRSSKQQTARMQSSAKSFYRRMRLIRKLEESRADATKKHVEHAEEIGFAWGWHAVEIEKTVARENAALYGRLTAQHDGPIQIRPRHGRSQEATQPCFRGRRQKGLSGHTVFGL
ncbi:hypothetical protein V494_08306 [Pseudogymnoascus sp. VKM F-4513 (FW-928)]|nr:hypothetical protein V494_08306 [Pseudogymnoascus sp. VKM F-4513 (FW-928)]